MSVFTSGKFFLLHLCRSGIPYLSLTRPGRHLSLTLNLLCGLMYIYIHIDISYTQIWKQSVRAVASRGRQKKTATRCRRPRLRVCTGAVSSSIPRKHDIRIRERLAVYLGTHLPCRAVRCERTCCSTTQFSLSVQTEHWSIATAAQKVPL